LYVILVNVVAPLQFHFLAANLNPEGAAERGERSRRGRGRDNVGRCGGNFFLGGKNQKS